MSDSPAFQTVAALSDWCRILKPGGIVEIWVPDGLKIAEAFVQFERTGVDNSHRDGWYRLNPEHDPCLWMAGRTFSCGDGLGTPGHPNWHLALFSPQGPLWLETGRFEQATQAALTQRGHPLRQTDLTSGLHGLQRVGGGWLGGADARREGAVRGD